MEPILFYGVPEGSSFGSIVALEWLGEPYKLCRIEMPEVVSSDAYKRINPVAETPSMITETGVAMSESTAILNHIGTRSIDKGLAFAQGTAGYDRLNQMLAFLNTDFYHSFAPLWYALEHESKGTEKEVLTAYGRDQTAKAHADLETMLGDHEWLLGDRRTLADAYFFGIARWADFHKVIDRKDNPGLQRLFRKLEDDPAVRFAKAVEHQEPARSAGGFAGEINLGEALSLLLGISL